MNGLKVNLVAQYELPPPESKQQEIEQKLVVFFQDISGLSVGDFNVEIRKGSWEVWITAVLVPTGAWFLEQVGSWVLNKYLDHKFEKQTDGDSKVSADAAITKISQPEKYSVQGVSIDIDFLKKFSSISDEVGIPRLIFGQIPDDGPCRVVEVINDNGEKRMNLFEVANREDFNSYLRTGLIGR